ncbi:hypothetical protein BT69DRAFT_15655 [Atractiella rhizophila]|nr:hypothetical protein BT69DRAFT_15655 [Atractiella rhizophila]
MSSFPPTSPTLPSHSNSLTSSTTHASYTSSAPIMAHPSPSLPAGYNRHSFLDPHQPLSPPPPHTTADVPLGSAGLPQGAAYQPQRSSYIPDAPEDGRYSYALAPAPPSPSPHNGIHSDFAYAPEGHSNHHVGSGRAGVEEEEKNEKRRWREKQRERTVGQFFRGFRTPNQVRISFYFLLFTFPFWRSLGCAGLGWDGIVCILHPSWGMMRDYGFPLFLE